MSSSRDAGRRLRAPRRMRRRAAFTLIEVVGALLIFSGGVLIVAGLTSSLAARMRDASLRSEVVGTTLQHLDSILVLPYDSVPAGIETDTLTIQGRAYLRTLEVVQQEWLVREIRLSLSPASPPGPGYEVVSHILAPW